MRTKTTISAIFIALFFTFILKAQDVKGPAREEEVSFNNGDAIYSGTLSLPEQEGVYPLVILVSGMGPQDRDWSFMGGKYRMAKIIAGYLNQHDIAVYRYDDRGFKKSTGTPEGQMSFSDLSNDIDSAAAIFRRRPDIGKIGLCGHSLGGILAVMTAAGNKDIDFIITLSGSFRNGADIMREQARTLKRWKTSDTMTEEEVIANGERFVDYLVSYAERGEDADGIKQTLTDLINYQISRMPPEKMAENMKVFSDTADLFRQTFDEAYGFYTSAHQKSFVTYNAAEDISKVSCPALILFGEKDRNVVVSSNLAPVAEGLKNSSLTDVTIKIIPGADHGYTNREYAAKGEMIPGTLEFITNWVLTRTGTNAF